MAAFFVNYNEFQYFLDLTKMEDGIFNFNRLMIISMYYSFFIHALIVA